MHLKSVILFRTFPINQRQFYLYISVMRERCLYDHLVALGVQGAVRGLAQGLTAEDTAVLYCQALLLVLHLPLGIGQLPGGAGQAQRWLS